MNEELFVIADTEGTSSITSTSASVNSSTKDRRGDPICQNCMAYTKIETVGWCKTKEDNTARKSTCEYFRRKKK